MNHQNQLKINMKLWKKWLLIEKR